MILPSEMFSYDPINKTMAACASDGPLYEMFRPGGGIPPKLHIESHRTGNVIAAEYLSRRDVNGEIESYTYFNHEHDLSVEIFND